MGTFLVVLGILIISVSFTLHGTSLLLYLILNPGTGVLVLGMSLRTKLQLDNARNKKKDHP